MSEGIEKKIRAGILGEADTFRADKFNTLSNYLIRIGNKTGVSISDTTLKEHLRQVLGLPEGTKMRQFRDLLPADHPLTPHFRVTENGQQFFIDKHLLILALDHLNQSREGNLHVTIRSATKTLASYVDELRKELSSRN